MQPITRLSFGLLASASVTTFAAAPSPADVATYDTAMKDAVYWGRLMFDHDQAAWKATDIVVKDPVVKTDHRLRGWITESTDSGVRVVFVGEENGRLVGLYESTPASRPDFVTDSPARPLTADELAEFTARQTAAAAMTSGCSKRYNTVVLPEGSGNDRKWRVYLIPGTTAPNVIPMGGYYRYEISEDGKTIIGQRGFTKSCLMLSHDTPKNAEPGGVELTHMLDPQPTEVHVFASLTYKQPVFVITMSNSMLWSVSGCCIKAVDKFSPASPGAAAKP